MKVLIVEDNETDRETITRFLSRFDIEVFCISTLREAYEKDAQADWDLILLDGNLPDADPFESGWFADVSRNAIVILTGSPEMFERLTFRKPIKVLNKNNMKEVVRETIGFLKKQLV
jgi:DNA-binding response OmpR family regulator